MNEHVRPVNGQMINRHCVDQLAEIRTQIKELQATEKEIAAEVSAMMGDADSLGGDEYIAKQSVTTRKGAIDTKAMDAAGIDPDRFRKTDVTVFSIRIERREASQ